MDACALLYGIPPRKACATQSAGYLDATMAPADFNPSDFGIHLSRRARGLPFWFRSPYGTDAYAEAVRSALDRRGAAEIDYRDDLELVRGRRCRLSCSVAVDGPGNSTSPGPRGCSPTRWPSSCRRPVSGETVLWFAFVNPRTTIDDVGADLGQPCLTSNRVPRRTAFVASRSPVREPSLWPTPAPAAAGADVQNRPRMTKAPAETIHPTMNQYTRMYIKGRVGQQNQTGQGANPVAVEGLLDVVLKIQMRKMVTRGRQIPAGWQSNRHTSCPSMGRS